jgi:hypothetical protein
MKQKKQLQKVRLSLYFHKNQELNRDQNLKFLKQLEVFGREQEVGKKAKKLVMPILV